MKRNDFLKTFMGGALIPLSFSKSLIQGEQPPLDKSVVEEFVSASHGNKDEVMAMLKERPTLLNAAFDWGGGDFETGLGAASHVGNITLAKYFVEQGAQTNIFTACLFGQIDIVKDILEAFPSSINAKGPHGYTLLHHAIKGGNSSLAIKDYLISKGATETRVPLY